MSAPEKPAVSGKPAPSTPSAELAVTTPPSALPDGQVDSGRRASVTRKIWRALRWGAAVAVIAFGTGLSATGHWKPCNEHLAKTGDSAVVTVCETPHIDDAPVIGALLLTFLLLWPDLAELGLPGGISLKRRLERNELKVEAQRERTEVLAERLALIQSQQQLALSSARAQNILILGDPKEALAQLEMKERVFGEELGLVPRERGEEERREKRKAQNGDVEADRGDLERELVRLWREIGARLRLADEAESYLKGETTAASTALTKLLESAGRAGVQQLLRWKELFREEIEIVQAARGAVLTDRPISSEDLAAAVEIAKRLLELPVPGE